MNQPFDKYSDKEQAFYVLGFNMGYKIDKGDMKKGSLLNALEKEFKKDKAIPPFSEGLLDGINTNEELRHFIYERMGPENRHRNLDQELEPDL